MAWSGCSVQTCATGWSRRGTASSNCNGDSRGWFAGTRPGPSAPLRPCKALPIRNDPPAAKYKSGLRPHQARAPHELARSPPHDEGRAAVEVVAANEHFVHADQGAERVAGLTHAHPLPLVLQIAPQVGIGGFLDLHHE